MREMWARSTSKRLVYRRVAELHVACITQGFLSTLGPRFLELMYRAIDEDPNSVLLTVSEGDHIIGLISAGVSMRQIYRRMLHYWPQVLIALLPSLVVPARFVKILEIAVYSRRAPIVAADAELFSMCVEAPYRGRGIAEKLYRQLCSNLKSREVGSFRIVAGASLHIANRFYSRMGAVVAGEVRVHSGAASTIYLHLVDQQH